MGHPAAKPAPVVPAPQHVASCSCQDDRLSGTAKLSPEGKIAKEWHSHCGTSLCQVCSCCACNNIAYVSWHHQDDMRFRLHQHLEAGERLLMRHVLYGHRSWAHASMPAHISPEGLVAEERHCHYVEACCKPALKPGSQVPCRLEVVCTLQ